jgi:hypothetical protein
MAHESAEFLASGAAPGVVGTLELESAELDEAEFALDTRPLEFISQPERHARTPMQIIMMIRVMMILFMIMSFNPIATSGRFRFSPSSKRTAAVITFCNHQTAHRGCVQ